MAYLKCWPNEKYSFAFISDRYTIKFREPVYETDIQTEFVNINLYMETGISNSHIWKLDSTKMSCLSIFQNATFLNSKNHYMKVRFRLTFKT